MPGSLWESNSQIIASFSRALPGQLGLSLEPAGQRLGRHLHGLQQGVPGLRPRRLEEGKAAGEVPEAPSTPSLHLNTLCMDRFFPHVLSHSIPPCDLSRKQMLPSSPSLYLGTLGPKEDLPYGVSHSWSGAMP